MRHAAYLDSGSVSMVTSAVVAGFAGIVVVFKMGFRRVASPFSRRQRATLRAEREAKAAAADHAVESTSRADS